MTGRIGIQTLQHGTSFADLASAWRHIDAVGLDSAWVMDHLFPMAYPSGRTTADGCFEAWTLLSALSMATTEVRVGCLVSSNTFRNPVLLAKMAATVDHATGGRLVLGIGAGWYEPDHTGSGLAFPPTGERIERLDEAIRVLRYCWSGSDAGFAGRFYPVAPGLPARPGPVHGRVPILVGGNSERVMRIAARYADTWNMYAPTYESFPGLLARFEKYCADAGRDPSTVHKTLHMPFSVDRTELRGAGDVDELIASGAIISGTADQIIEQLQRYRSAGADGFILGCEPPYRPESLTLLAREVAPALH